jgi:hypothetical protein
LRELSRGGASLSAELSNLRFDVAGHAITRSLR